MSFRLKTILGIAFIELILLAILIVSGIGWLRDSNEQQIINNGERLSRTFAIAVRDAVISTDLANLRAFTREAVQHSDIAYIRIRSDQGKTLAEESLLPKDSPPPNYDETPSLSSDGIYDIRSNVMIDDFNIGQIEVGLDVSAFSQLINDAQKYAVSLALLEMGLVALFSLLFGSLLTKQLLELRQSALRIQENGPGETVPIKGNDEVAQVAEAFNSMSVALSHSYKEISWEKDRFKQLAKQNKLLAEIVEQSHEAYLVTDLSGVVSNANQALFELTGYDERNATGIHFQTLLFGEHTAEEAAYRLSDAMAQGQSITVRATCLTRSNASLRTEITVIPIHGGSGNVERFALIVRDVREHYALELKLREAADIAQQATRAKSVFLANMSHAIRTPMNGIIGLSELLKDSPLSKEQADFATIINNSANELLQLMNDLLDFSKLEANQLTLEQVVFSIQDVVEETATLASVTAAEKELLVVIDIPPELNTWVLGDETRLRQVLYNLLSNAVKFTPHGYIKVVVRGAPSDDPTTSAFSVSVEDTGVGISTDKIDELTHSFDSNDAFDSRRYSGTGLGLSITRSLLELFDSQLELESEPGKGSKFSFSLCLPHCQPEHDHLGVFKGRNIAVVNADPLHRPLLDRYLNHWQAETTYLNSLEHPSLASQQFDVAIVMAGQIEDLNPTPHCPWVGVVAKMRQLNLEATDRDRRLIAKPLRMNQLLQELQLAMQSEPQLVRIAPQNAAAELSTLNNFAVAIVDDMEYDREIIRLYIEGMTENITFFSSGAEAIAHYRRNLFDILITDVTMPEMDGYELTQKIRKFEEEHQLPSVFVIGLSAHAGQEDSARAFAAGMNSYLTKPVSRSRLQKTLQEAAKTRLAKLTSD